MYSRTKIPEPAGFRYRVNKQINGGDTFQKNHELISLLWSVPISEEGLFQSPKRSVKCSLVEESS